MRNPADDRPKVDFFRDTWVRYLGYANEVGESFRTVVPRRVVTLSYQVAFAYVLADTAHKTLRMIDKDGRPGRVIAATGDALIWQTLASIVIPGFVINRIRYYSSILLNKCKFQASPVRSYLSQPKVPLGIPIKRICVYSHRALTKRSVGVPVRKWVPVALGLISIPIIITPIDRAVDFLMNQTYRRVF